MTGNLRSILIHCPNAWEDTPPVSNNLCGRIGAQPGHLVNDKKTLRCQKSPPSIEPLSKPIICTDASAHMTSKDSSSKSMADIEQFLTRMCSDKPSAAARAASSSKACASMSTLITSPPPAQSGEL